MGQLEFNAYLFSFQKSRTLCGHNHAVKAAQRAQCAHGTVARVRSGFGRRQLKSLKLKLLFSPPPFHYKFIDDPGQNMA